MAFDLPTNAKALAMTEHAVPIMARMMAAKVMEPEEMEAPTTCTMSIPAV